MSCVVLSCDELSSVVKWCGAMGWDLMSLWCDVAGCDVTLIGSKLLCGVNWKMIWWSVLHRSTPCYKVLLQYYSVLLQYDKVLLQYYSVLQSTTPVLLRTTPVLQSTTPVLFCTTPALLRTTQYYSVLQSTTPVLLCTTKYYSRLLQYYSVLHSTTPYYKVLPHVLLGTTKYYSSTILYYKVLLQYYSVLQSTTPVLFCTTKYYSGTTPCTTKYSFARLGAPTSPNAAPATQNDSHDWSSSHMKRETSFTMRRATGLILQRHQLLRLPHKMTLMIDVPHAWHVIYNARSNRSHPPTSPNAAPATQNDSHHLSSWHMKRHLQCAEQHASPSNITK